MNALYEFVKEDGKVYVLRTTLTEEYVFDPDEVRDVWGRREDRFQSFEDWVIEKFQMHDGSQYADRFFYNTASPDYGVELIVRNKDD